MTVESSILVDHGDQESNSTSEEAEPGDADEQSGHSHPAEVPTEDIVTVSEHSGDSSDPGATSLTSPITVTLSAPSMEAEANSPEILTFTHKNNAPSGAETPENIQDKAELEGSGEVFHSTAPNVTESDGEEMEQEAREGSGESSGERPEVKSGLLLTNPTPSTDHNSEGLGGDAGTDEPRPSDVKITLIPRLTLTPSWEPEPSSSSPQESRSDREYSAEPPVTEQSDDASTEHEVVSVIPTSSINGQSNDIQKHIPGMKLQGVSEKFVSYCLLLLFETCCQNN